jgi:hypothetical protein
MKANPMLVGREILTGRAIAKTPSNRGQDRINPSRFVVSLKQQC